MIPTRPTERSSSSPAPVAVFAAVALAATVLAGTAGAQSAEELVTRDLDGYVLEDTEFQGPAGAMASFATEDGSARVHLALAYGEEAAGLSDQLSRRWADRTDIREVEVDGLTFQAFRSGNDVAVLRYEDDRLILAGGPIPDDGSAEALQDRAVALLEAWGPARVTDWSPPAGSTEKAPRRVVEAPAEAPAEAEPARASARCGPDMQCFMDALRDCQPASASPAAGPSVQVLYRVEGAAGADVCQVSFRFTENPNPSLVDRPMSFTVDPDAANDAAIRDIMTRCLSGDEDAIEAHSCQGPLVGAMGGQGRDD